MDNLTRWLEEVSLGLDEAADTIRSADGMQVEDALEAIRDYASQMRAVADANGPRGIDWSRLEDLVGIDILPAGASVLRIGVRSGGVLTRAAFRLGGGALDRVGLGAVAGYRARRLRPLEAARRVVGSLRSFCDRTGAAGRGDGLHRP